MLEVQLTAVGTRSSRLILAQRSGEVSGGLIGPE